MRKIIQLLEVDSYLHALCEDGTAWCHTGPNGWSKIEAIPQEPDEHEEQEPEREEPWPPKGVTSKLWAEDFWSNGYGLSRSIVEITTPLGLRQILTSGYSIVEAETKEEADEAFKNRKGPLVNPMLIQFDGKRVNILSTAIPF